MGMLLVLHSGKIASIVDNNWGYFPYEVAYRIDFFIILFKRYFKWYIIIHRIFHVIKKHSKL